MNYALNWALCAKGVAPQGEAYRNLREAELKKHNASIPGGYWPLLAIQESQLGVFETLNIT